MVDLSQSSLWSVSDALKLMLDGSCIAQQLTTL
jgi:hypothetical protein